ncbi:hypothetical protein ACTA71_005032 [Dictyostelium dimigraforme]
MIYTNIKGETRIRIHNLRLSVDSVLTNLFKDQVYFFEEWSPGENPDEANSFGCNDPNTGFLKKNWLKYVNELQLLLNSSLARLNKYVPAEIVFGRLPVLSPVDGLATVM